VSVQVRTRGGGWRTVAGGRTDARGGYTVAWTVPRRSATYTVRTATQATAGFVQGASRSAVLRVKF
jgi:hypothetical protein